MTVGVKLSVIALVAVLPSWAWADDCPNAKTQAELDACAGRAFATADKALNLVYNQIMDRLDKMPAGRKLLVVAQKDWLAFRDAECAFETVGSSGGSIQPMAVAQCRATLTTARTRALRALLACPEGDSACPLPPN